MREIKFRYVCKRDNGHTFSQIFTIGEIEQGDAHRWGQQNFVGMFHFERCEYTGLKDKNGKEIYEGDIVKHKVNGLWETDEIKWVAGSFIVGNWLPGDITLARYDETLEVIGNIYGNPLEK